MFVDYSIVSDKLGVLTNNFICILNNTLYSYSIGRYHIIYNMNTIFDIVM